MFKINNEVTVLTFLLLVYAISKVRGDKVDCNNLPPTVFRNSNGVLMNNKPHLRIKLVLLLPKDQKFGKKIQKVAPRYGSSLLFPKWKNSWSLFITFPKYIFTKLANIKRYWIRYRVTQFFPQISRGHLRSEGN